MTLNFSWSTVATIVAALAGIAGTIITPIYGSQLAGGVQAVLQALSALLLIIGGGAPAIVAVRAATLKNALKIAAAHSAAVPGGASVNIVVNA